MRGGNDKSSRMRLKSIHLTIREPRDLTFLQRVPVFLPGLRRGEQNNSELAVLPVLLAQSVQLPGQLFHLKHTEKSIARGENEIKAVTNLAGKQKCLSTGLLKAYHLNYYRG